MASPEAEEGSPSGSLAISLALEHLNLVYNVSLQGFKEWLPEVPPDSLLYVDIAKDALAAAATEGRLTSEELNAYAGTLAAIKRRVQGDGPSGSATKKFGEQELEELQMWAESRRQRSALQELYDFLEKKKSQAAAVLHVEDRRAVDKGKRQQGDGDAREEDAAGPTAADGAQAQAGPSGEAAVPPPRHVRKRKVVEYEEEPEPVLPKRSTRSADAVAGSDVSERRASRSPVRRKDVEGTAGKESTLGVATRSVRGSKKEVHEPQEPVPERKKSAAGRPAASKGVKAVAPEVTAQETRGSRGQHAGGKAGWGSLDAAGSEPEQPKKHQAPPPEAFLSPPVGGGGPGDAGASATQCFSCKGGPVLGFLIPCLGRCGKWFHVSCPGLSKPSLIEFMTQRCEECIEALEEAAKAARSSAQGKVGAKGAAASGPAAKARPGRGQNERARDLPTHDGAGEGGGEDEHGDGDVEEQGGPEVDNEIDDEIEDDSEEPAAHYDLRDKDYRESLPTKSRKAKRGYSKEEDAKLVEGMERYGGQPNKWQLIQRFGRNVFQDRDPVSLKDRWRNLQKYL